MKELYNKIALVTGGSRGIGRAISKELANQGAKVIINYDKNNRIAKDFARSIHGKAYLADVINSLNCYKMIQEIIRLYGRIDILVNNVGGISDKTLKKMDNTTWNRVIDLNINTVYNVTNPVIPHMLERNSGKIINISSVSGQIGFVGQTNYSAAKAGIIGFTKALAKELAPNNITVNAIAPGLVNTPSLNKIPREKLEELLLNIPLHRVGKPEEIANAAMFLLNNDYVTGQVINVNGGMYM